MVDEEELKKLRNYLVNATKWIKSEDRNYQVPATLQIFLDDQGNVKYIREV